MKNDVELCRIIKNAKESGGPDKLVELLIASGNKEVLFWIGVAFFSGATFAGLIPKVIKSF